MHPKRDVEFKVGGPTAHSIHQIRLGPPTFRTAYFGNSVFRSFKNRFKSLTIKNQPKNAKFLYYKNLFA